MKRFYLLTIFILLACMMSKAQKMTVEGFEPLPTDITALTQSRLDATGERCALVKVQLARYGATFEGNVVNPTGYDQSEYTVYMTNGSKFLKVKMEGYLPLDVTFADYGISSLESGKTYRLTISLPFISGSAGDDGHSYLSLTVVPNQARVTIDGSFYSLSNDGTLTVRLRRGDHTYRLSADGYQTKEGRFTLGTDTYFLTETLVSTLAALIVHCGTPDANILVNNVMRGRGSWTGQLQAGTYNVEVLKDGYISQRESVVLAESGADTIVFPALLPMTGQLDVNYRPVGAEVWIDGMQKGKSPNRFRDITAGTHKVDIRSVGYRSKTISVTVRHNDIAYIQGSLEKDTVATSSQSTPPAQAQQSQPIPTATAAAQPQSSQISVASPKVDRLASFYLEGKFQAGSMMAAGASVGGYVGNFNIEGTFLLGLSESEEIGWQQTSQSSGTVYSYTYKPMFFGLKLGYGITCGKNFRVTPQVGIGLSSITGTEVQKGTGTNPDATSCYALPASVSVRLEYYITRHFGLSASPEFAFPVIKSDTYAKLSDFSSKVKGFGSGFNARVGVFVSF